MNRAESDGFDLDADVAYPWEGDDDDNLDPFGDAAFPRRLSRRALW